MKGAKYAGFLAVLMAFLILGAIPAIAIQAEDSGDGNGDAEGERNETPNGTATRSEDTNAQVENKENRRVRIVRGKFTGPITDEDGTENGKLFGVYTIYIKEDGSTQGRFMSRWKYNDIKGRAGGVMRDGELKGRWTELPKRPTVDTTDDDVEEAEETEVCIIHYGTLMGKYELSDEGILMRGSWEDSVSGETGYFKAEEYVQNNPPQKGRFKGVWVKVDPSTDLENEVPDVEGRLYGFYTKSPDQPGGRFVGRYMVGDDERGCIHGRYRNGEFKGVWRNGRGDLTGYLHGTYADGTFEGRWFYADGTPGGYLKGEYGLVTAEDPSGMMNQNGTPVEA